MGKSKKVAIASFVMREKQYLCALRAVERVISLCTMHFADEVMEVDEIDISPPAVKVDDREVKMAQHLIDSLSSKFKPEKYHDEYRERVMEMIEQKAKGEEVVTQPAVSEKPHRVINLMAALEASLAEAKKQKRRTAHAGNGHETRRRKSA